MQLSLTGGHKWIDDPLILPKEQRQKDIKGQTFEFYAAEQWEIVFPPQQHNQSSKIFLSWL